MSVSPIAFARFGAVASAWMSLCVGVSSAAEFTAAGYSFSDELGGFRLLSASGSGKPEDPVIITEEILDVAPVTLVIRNLNLVEGRPLQAQLTLEKRVTNRSVRVWGAFEMELQEIKGKPSVYSDGLSFKQFAASDDDVSSDSFAQNERDFEPYDRIQFLQGHVDPDATAAFKVTITDATPVPEFYLVQDPKLLSASLPMAHRDFAALERRSGVDHDADEVRTPAGGKY